MWIVILRACYLEGNLQVVGKKIKVAPVTGSELIASGKAAATTEDPPPRKSRKAD